MIVIREFSSLLVRNSRFACGVPDLHRWLAEHASQQNRRHNVRTMLAVDETEVRVAGYHASRTYEIRPDDPQHTGKPGRYPVPAVLLARLAVDQDYQGAGIGRLLLLDALRRIARASEDLGFEVLVVDALHEDAARFYLRYGFRRFADRRLRLFMATKDLRASFAATDGDAYI